MILSVHAIFGAAVASVVPNHPVEAFCLGFLSHLALDTIPHRDYDLISLDFDPTRPALKEVSNKLNLMRDFSLVSLDAAVGLCLAFVFFFNPAHPKIFLLGAVGALLPDFLTFVFLLFKYQSFRLFYNFHIGIIHSKIILKLNQVTGVILQFCTIAVFIAIIFGIRYFLI